MHDIYPYWSIDCDNPIDEYTKGCRLGYTGLIYNNDNGQWVITLSSQNNDYYKVYTTDSLKYFVPLTAMWTDADTQSGISQSQYRFTIECDVALTLEPTYVTEAVERRVETNYVYDQTWFWLTMVLIVIFIILICLLLYLFNKKRKERPDVIQFDARDNKGEEIVGRIPKIKIPKRYSVQQYLHCNNANTKTVSGVIHQRIWHKR